jgi:sugar phosphate isomerase/epimerase
MFTRRRFAATTLAAVAPLTARVALGQATLKEPVAPRISLAQWSLHRAFFERRRDPLEFAAITRNDFGLAAVEYVNTFYFERAHDSALFADLARRAADEGVTSLLIMCDRLGALGDPDENERRAAVERHRPWLDAAARLGCHSIRVNAASRGEREQQSSLAADGLAALAGIAAGYPLNVLVENHGGLSSDGSWLAATLARAGQPNLGSLPDFGNFRIDEQTVYDRYLGVEQLMPFARALSAKSYDFDEAGEETTIDYARMFAIATRAGYRGWIGVEYEGDRLSEDDGIRATTRLLERHLGIAS